MEELGQKEVWKTSELLQDLLTQVSMTQRRMFSPAGEATEISHSGDTEDYTVGWKEYS